MPHKPDSQAAIRMCKCCYQEIGEELVVGRILTLLAMGELVVGTGVGCGSTPSSEAIVQAFEDQDLPVGETLPVGQVDGWEKSLVPKTYEEGTHFDVPGQGKGHGAQVFIYESQDDLKVMRDYYKEIEEMPTIGPSLHSHLYQDGLVLLQVRGTVPKPQANRYGDVLEEV